MHHRIFVLNGSTRAQSINGLFIEAIFQGRASYGQQRQPFGSRPRRDLH